MKKFRKVVLVLMVCLFAVLGTGCGVYANVKTSMNQGGTKVSVTESFGWDEKSIEELCGIIDMSKDEFIGQISNTEGVSCKRKKMYGEYYYVVTTTVKGVKLSAAEEGMEDLGLSDVCYTSDCFYAKLPAMGSMSEMLGYDELLDKDNLSAEERKQLEQLVEELNNAELHGNLTIAFNKPVKASNGEIDGKTVTWSYDKLSKQKYLYASTKNAKSTAKISGIAKNKTYKIGKKIAVKNPSSVAKLTLNGKAVKNGTAITAPGSYTVKVWSMDGKYQQIKFKVK